MISILNHTRKTYSESIAAALNKGFVHAGIAYTEWFREGKITGNHPAFNNAKMLLEEILKLTDCSIPSLSTVMEQDGTTKFLLQTVENLETESVIIPMQSGNTLCVSSQVGCRMGCAFCETGRMGLLKNLSAKEIVSQFFHARFSLGMPVRNIVFMGMGEPLDNYEQVMKAVAILTDPAGIGLGKSRITISTSGCVEGIYKLIDDADPAINLAVSVNAPNDKIRNRLMPVNRKHQMDSLHAAMTAYCQHPRREILVEYVLIKGINDALTDADELAAYLNGLRVKVNLIPYNSQSRSRFSPPEPEQLEAFALQMRGHGYYTLWRQPKGRTMMAACGQLGNLNFRKGLQTENTF